jgi:hypothetical protein
VGGPGLDFETWVFRPGPFARGNPGLKIETWATHQSLGVCVPKKRYLAPSKNLAIGTKEGGLVAAEQP